MFTMPLYEAKHHGEDEWMEISELELMDQLYRTYKQITPVIKKMIMGKQVEAPDGIYRLKLKGGEQSGEQSELYAA